MTQASIKEAKDRAKSAFGGLFGKVSMYGDKEGVVVFHGNNPSCFFDVKVMADFKHEDCRCHCTRTRYYCWY